MTDMICVGRSMLNVSGVWGCTLLFLRQRRRQQYHSSKLAKGTFGKKKGTKPRKTIDEGVFSQPLKPPRRTITIKTKLEILKRYVELMKEKNKNRAAATEPKPLGGTREQLQKWTEERRAALKAARQSVFKQVKHEFPGVIKSAQICKWLKTARREKWHDLPEIIQTRCVATKNTWRSAAGLPSKGKTEGGKIPVALQVELDRLMCEISSGSSSISERKEIVTIEHVVPLATLAEWSFCC